MISPLKAPGGGDQNNCAVAGAIHVSRHTHHNLVEFRKRYPQPSPPRHPLIAPSLGHDPGGGMKIPSYMFCIFLFTRRHTKFGLKIFEIDFVNEVL